MKQIYIFILGILILVISCKKKETGPSIYNFKIVDIYSGLPVPNAKAVLRHTTWPASIQDITIGYSNSNGEFQYICDKESDHTSDNYSYYSIYFISQNCPYNNHLYHIPNSVEVTQTHETNYYTFELLQSATLHLRTRRVSIDPYGLGSSFCGINVYSNSWAAFSSIYARGISYFNDTINQVHDTCFCVPSNEIEIIASHILYNCNNLGTSSWSAQTHDNSSDSVNIGYNDTTYFNIDY